MSERILSYIPPNFDITFVNQAHGSERIESILFHTPSYLEMYNPWAVILFWDSDCSDVNEFGMDKEAVA